MKNKTNIKSESFRMRISETFKNKMKQIAANKGKTVSQYIRDSVEQDYQQELK